MEYAMFIILAIIILTLAALVGVILGGFIEIEGEEDDKDDNHLR